eukprot:gene7298-11617_t
MKTKFSERVKLKQELTVPPKIKAEWMVMATDFHPKEDLFALSEIDGKIQLYNYSKIENTLKKTWTKIHKESCRNLFFSDDGNHLFTISTDKSICMIDLNSEKTGLRMRNAHEAEPSALLIYDDNVIITGDDNGCIKFWDVRKKENFDQLHENGDFISSFDYHEEMVYAGSGDGCLTSYNMNMREYHTTSESLEDDILSTLVLQDGQTIACGTTSGKINLFSKRNIWESSDAFTLEFGSIDCLLYIDNEMFLAGSSNGEVHNFKVNPKRVISKICEHDIEQPISKLSLSRDGKFMSSCGDDVVKFWDSSFLYGVESDDDEQEQEEEKPKKKKLKTNSERNKFFYGFQGL